MLVWYIWYLHKNKALAYKTWGHTEGRHAFINVYTLLEAYYIKMISSISSSLMCAWIESIPSDSYRSFTIFLPRKHTSGGGGRLPYHAYSVTLDGFTKHTKRIGRYYDIGSFLYFMELIHSFIAFSLVRYGYDIQEDGWKPVTLKACPLKSRKG